MKLFHDKSPQKYGTGPGLNLFCLMHILGWVEENVCCDTKIDTLWGKGLTMMFVQGLQIKVVCLKTCFLCLQVGNTETEILGYK